MLVVVVVFMVVVVVVVVVVVEVENAFLIFKVSRLVSVDTDSHHNDHNKMIFAVSDVCK